MGKAPASQFYWGDWRRDPAVRACSLSARGLWIDMLAIMWECPNQGYFSLNGSDPSPEDASRMVGCTAEEYGQNIAELETRHVFSRDCHGVIFNRRMVRECNERARWRDSKRKQRRDVPQMSRNSPGVSSSSSSSSSSKQKKIYKRKMSDKDWIKEIKTLHPWLDWDDLNRDMDTWLLNHPMRQKTRKFITNWILNKQSDKPMTKNELYYFRNEQGLWQCRRCGVTYTLKENMEKHRHEP